MNNLRQMSIFAHVVEAGSVSLAAEKLDLSKSVVSQHIKALEQDLGVSLLKRTTRRQHLTEAGKQFYQHCRDINAIASNAWTEAQQTQTEPEGRIRITAPNALMDTLVAPTIASLMQRYPKLKPELINDDRHLNLMEHDIDLAVRVGQSPDSNIKQKRLGEFRDVLCAGSQFRGVDVCDIPYIANAWQGAQIKHRFESRSGESIEFQWEARCITNSINSCLALVRAGAGACILPAFYFKQFQPELIDLLPGKSLPLNPVYALTPYAHKVPLAVSLCICEIQSLIGKES